MGTLSRGRKTRTGRSLYSPGLTGFWNQAGTSNWQHEGFFVQSLHQSVEKCYGVVLAGFLFFDEWSTICYVRPDEFHRAFFIFSPLKNLPSTCFVACAVVYYARTKNTLINNSNNRTLRDSHHRLRQGEFIEIVSKTD